MSVFKSKSASIIILTSEAIITQAPFPYAIALLIPLIPLQRPLIATVLTILGLLPQIIEGIWIEIVLAVLVIIIHVFYHGLPWRQYYQAQPESPLISKYLIFIYFFFFSFLSLANHTIPHNIGIFMLYLMLLIYSVRATASPNLRYFVIICSSVSIIWGILAFTCKNTDISVLKFLKNYADEPWWYYLMISFSSWLGFMLSYQIKIQQNPNYYMLTEQDTTSKRDRLNSSIKKKEEIQMREMPQNKSKKSEGKLQKKQSVIEEDSKWKTLDIRKSIQGQRANSIRHKLPPLSPQLIDQKERQLGQKLLKQSQQEEMILQKHREVVRSVIENQNKKQGGGNGKQSRDRAVSQTNFGIQIIHHPPRNVQHVPAPYQSLKNIKPPGQIYNGNGQNTWSEHQGQGEITNLFLLIPFTLFSPSYLQIPVYFYLIWLQSGRTPMWVFYIMFLSICAIIFQQRQSSLPIKILLRLCLILIVNKNFKIAISITRLLRSIWLRSSFVLVLMVLFWFSLLTVNLFHISFVLIVLLFITKTNNPHSQQPSFRHQNWKYLILLFNIFLVLRLFWLISQRDLHLQIPQKLDDILKLFGIPYSYNLSWEYFNMIPLLVSGVLTVQYWTYTSRIYDQQIKKTLQFLPTYRTLVLKLLEIFTIIYYKLIPWTSHLIVIVIIISLEFSFIADLVLIWSLFILLVHMIKPHEVSSYRIIYRMWNIFLRLVSIQIILRYIFEFIKFPIIFGNISQFPIIKTLIKYQQILGLAIRQSSNSYLKNVFTKFQLMMILDFTIIAISFLVIQYYEIMIKYYEIEQKKSQLKEKQIEQIKKSKNGEHRILQLPKLQTQNFMEFSEPKFMKEDENDVLKKKASDAREKQNEEKSNETISQNDAVFIYKNYIDFKLTKWLQNFNELMLMFSKLFLKIYYPLLATYSSIYYSYATMSYFLCSVYYYLKINTKYYQVDVVSQVQSRVMKLFRLWRLKNNIRVNEVKIQSMNGGKNGTSNDTGANSGEVEMKEIDVEKMKERERERYERELMRQVIQQEPIDQNEKEKQLQQLQKIQQKPQVNFPPLVRELKKQVKVINPRILFDNFIALHSRLRYWLLILTMIYIVMNYTSRLFISDEVHDLMQKVTIENWRFLLFMCGTSKQSPINIEIYLIIVGLTVIEIKCCSLIRKIGRPGDLSEEDNIMDVSFDDLEIEGEELKKSKDKSYSPQDRLQVDQSKSFCESQFRKKSLRQIEDKDNQKFVDIEISLRLGINKIAERFFVILLVFVSLLQNDNPFSIIYLVCAWFLNFMGTKSIQGLSWILSFLVIFQYSLIITDTTNKYIGAMEIFSQYANYSWVITLFNVTDRLWISYLTFGNNINEIFVMYLSMVILMLYEACFFLEEHNWFKVLVKMREKVRIGFIQRKIYEHFSRIYEYALVYSPLCITTLCLGLYLMDFTATNMFLSILSIVFLFKSFLLENYSNSRPFWKSYFRLLQILIVLFMVVYCILSAPMYQQYCNKMLCSPQQFHTKITKTILLLILQIGIDLISSHHFKNAMDTLENTLNQTSSYYRIAISYVQNDKKIAREFKSLKRKENIKTSLKEIKQFINLYENDQSVKFDNRKQVQAGSQSWLDAVLELLPSLIDAELIKTPEETKDFVKSENKEFIEWLQKKNGRKLNEEEMRNINQLYVNEFQQCKSIVQLKEKIKETIGEKPPPKERNMIESVHSVHPLKRQRKISYENQNDSRMSQSAGGVRKSYIHGILPFDDELEILQSAVKKPTNVQVIPELEKQEQIIPINRKSGDRLTTTKRLSTVNEEQKKKLLYLLIFESVLSNWHYLTYSLMILEFIINMGVLTLPFPILTFTIGIVHSYQAPKTLWRLAFLSLLPPIFFKYSLQIQLIQPSETLQFVLIGSHNTSILIEYFLMFFIIIQCLILKIVGLYDQSTAQVQCMNVALIRNIINFDKNNQQEERKALFTLLERSKSPSETFFQYLFSLYQCKSGYDYSTMMVAFQLTILVYIFCFYDNMAVRQQLTFYKMIEYNQFTTGMVVMAFIQLSFMLLDRILTVLELSYKKWDVTLILKYIVLITSLIYVHTMVLVFFPINSGYFGSNKYIIVFYILHIFYFLISSLQVKVGVNKQSRGFMDRYTWYNGYIYMAYRAIPFLFEFKIFSDWTFTSTSLRLFDWIKYEQLLGYLYVAKCNSLFLRGKILGSKIEWWKKLLMGFPLLLFIILLVFGPLILFSSLNPLASLNQITGGYLQLSLKVNKTNQYPFYINTHMADIHFLDKEPDAELQQIIKTYELDQKSIQIVHLEPYSNQYWEISQGSYDKLIEQPQNSLYQLIVRVRFDRNQTKTTPFYVFKPYTIPLEQVPDFKETLQGKKPFRVKNFVPAFMRLDNNNGLHFLTDEYLDIQFHAQENRTLKKKYWVISDGITFKMASDKYSKAIFGYSVMSFYISIILVVANYFRFLFQGSAYTIIMSDIPYADPLLAICDGIHQARLRKDIYEEQILYWSLIDVIRSPDLMKALTGNYLNARIETLQLAEQPGGQQNKKEINFTRRTLPKIQKFQ